MLGCFYAVTPRDLECQSGGKILNASDWGASVFGLTVTLLAVSLLLGGATRQGFVSDAVPELVSLPVLAVALPRALPILKRSPIAIALTVGVVSLPGLQLIPLPPELWISLPGREFVAEILTSVGTPLSWRPISLIPSDTCRALLSLLPAVAMFLATLNLDHEERQFLLLLGLVIGVASALLAMLQVLGGSDGGLYFFSFTNKGRGVGFFASANHFAGFEYTLLPLGAAALTGMRIRSPAFLLAVLGCALPALLFGLALSGSRSAIVLGSASLAATITLLMPEFARLGRYRALALAVGLAAVLIPLMMGLGMQRIFTRFANEDVAEDARWTIAASTWEGIRSYLPFGAGIGTFPSVYPVHERVIDLMPKFVNRAHDDGLETLLEGGMGSLVLLVGFVVWLSIATHRALLGEPGSVEGRLAKGQARAGLIVMWLLLLHSLWDYPLRTIALEAVFALCAALQFPPRLSRRQLRAFRRSWWDRTRMSSPNRSAA